MPESYCCSILLAQFSASLDFACLYRLVESSGCYTVRALFYILGIECSLVSKTSRVTNGLITSALLGRSPWQFSTSFI